MGNPILLAKVDAALRYPSAAAESYAAMLHSAIDTEACETLFNAVCKADAQIDRKAMSGWDRALIARNAEIHPPENPLSPLIHSLVQSLLIVAAERVSHRIGQHRANLLRGLCLAE